MFINVISFQVFISCISLLYNLFETMSSQSSKTSGSPGQSSGSQTSQGQSPGLPAKPSPIPVQKQSLKSKRVADSFFAKRIEHELNQVREQEEQMISDCIELSNIVNNVETFVDDAIQQVLLRDIEQFKNCKPVTPQGIEAQHFAKLFIDYQNNYRKVQKFMKDVLVKIHKCSFYIDICSIPFIEQAISDKDICCVCHDVLTSNVKISVAFCCKKCICTECLNVWTRKEKTCPHCRSSEYDKVIMLQ